MSDMVEPMAGKVDEGSDRLIKSFILLEYADRYPRIARKLQIC
jgi:hypothetical protein